MADSTAAGSTAVRGKKAAMSAGGLLATLVTAAAPAGASATAAERPVDTPPDAATQVEELASAHPDTADRVQVFRDHGLNDEQILTLLTDPSEAEVSWETSVTDMSPNVEITNDANGASMQLPDGRWATPDMEAAASTGPFGESCGFVETNHDGSTFAQRSARLRMRTDWCWKNGLIFGTPANSHSASVTAYGNAGGWRINPSYGGTNAWLQPQVLYQTEAKVDWRVLYCAVPTVGGCVQVQSGTAWQQHHVSPNQKMKRYQGGWPY